MDELVSVAMQQVDPIDYNYRDYAEEIAWQVADSYGPLGKDELTEVLNFVKDYYGKPIRNYYIKRNEILYEEERKNLIMNGTRSEFTNGRVE